MNAKEKGEFEVMKNEISHIKNDLTKVDKKVDLVLDKLEQHTAWEETKYKELDEKYATKEKVKQLEVKFDTWNKNQDTLIKSRGDKVWEITMKLLPYLLFGTILALMKYGPVGI